MKRSPISRVFLALLLAFAIPLLLAIFFVYRGSWPGMQVNKGHLYHPAIQMGDLPWKSIDGKPFLWKNNAQNKWLMVYVIPPECDELCKKTIYHLHQVQIALNKDQEQFQRVLLFVSPTTTKNIKLITEDHYAQGAQRLRLSPEAFARLALPEHERIFILDPAQWLVLGYTQEANPSDILKDLQRLMRAFHLGHNKT